MSPSNLVVVLTGSIAGYKASAAISRLVQRGHRVRTVATPAALRFIGPATLEGLTGSPPLTDLFAPGAALDHINLTRWADLVLVCPATANTLNRLAAGLADDLPGALFLAHDRTKPWLVAPAMNPAMWAHPATQAAVGRLQDWGVHFLPVGEGRTACGETGEGRLPEPDDIVAAVEAALAPREPRLRVLVTAGGTAEPIDGVRVLTNSSTGRTGALLASHLARAGHDVVLLRARSAVAAPPGCREELFGSFDELDAALTRQLGANRYDAVVHAAAVGDFAVEAIVLGGVERAPGRGKLEAASGPVSLRLRRQPKLVDAIRARSRNPDLTLVAFKLTAGASEAEAARAVRDLFAHSGADLVVHNDENGRAAGDDFPAVIHPASGHPPVPCRTRSELAATLERLLVSRPGKEPSPTSTHAALP
ncbi:MAG TPA: bifunctional phosphopantothenoylcysteine decarboxylase/phosphopantothenate--cysteine ligase CoaBC [Lacunisphaera sp.]|nr:bifunctional phosphopantothenoylcysteine decarboxylase/phosphopantothenate--cysteine ligase CoaBC [Lacunisphaera sp.]